MELSNSGMVEYSGVVHLSVSLKRGIPGLPDIQVWHEKAPKALPPSKPRMNQGPNPSTPVCGPGLTTTDTIDTIDTLPVVVVAVIVALFVPFALSALFYPFVPFLSALTSPTLSFGLVV